jgi:Tfp pilus assembly protein PilF
MQRYYDRVNALEFNHRGVVIDLGLIAPIQEHFPRMTSTNPEKAAPSSLRSEAEFLFFEGTQALGSGDPMAAESALRRAIDLVPDFAEAHANLALALERQQDLATAEACYRKSIGLNPGIARTHLNLGVLLAAQKRFEDAEAAYSQAIELDANLAAAWSNLGVLHACVKREADAERCYRTAMAIDPEYKLAAFNLSYVLLRQARFEEGWERFEARDWYAAFAQRASCPRWQGERLAGKSLLIGYEAGHGDMIHFGRYAAELKERGARHITMVCHPALTRLFSSLRGVDRVSPFDEAIPATEFDYWTPLLSLPYRCATRLDSIPAQLPYLSASLVDIEKWKARLPADGLRVGLAWQGNPKFENDADRSLPSLDALAPLGAVSGVRFISLQKGVGEDEAARPPNGLPLVPVGAQADDFADTAAIIANLDLVISVDTATAHLAGAMGKPCWVLLPHYKTDWRWLVARKDSPWYPQVMRLFRQPVAGQWRATVEEVAAALALFARDRGKSAGPMALP